MCGVLLAPNPPCLLELNLIHFYPLAFLPHPQELKAEEDRIYAAWMAQAEGAAKAARAAYHERRKQQLMEVSE